jgi:hypothetical protein
MNIFPSSVKAQPVQNDSPGTIFSQPDLVLPFLPRFLEAASPAIDGDPTAGASTPYQTGLDNKFENDTMEDEDEDNDPRPDQTGLIADSYHLAV